MQLQLLHSGKMTFFSSENSVSRSQVKKEADPMGPMCRRFAVAERIAKPSIPYSTSSQKFRSRYERASIVARPPCDDNTLCNKSDEMQNASQAVLRVDYKLQKKRPFDNFSGSSSQTILKSVWLFALHGAALT